MSVIAVSNLSTGHQGINGWVGVPDSSGGVSVKFSFKNIGEKPIKYARFCFIPYNRVGDIVSCSITQKTENSVQYTGPLIPNGIACNLLFDNAWYNHSITSVRIQNIEITYMDGGMEIVEQSDVKTFNGCYIATAIYGSYDCPNVWTLRRFRDYNLATTVHGRMLIKIYYAISPSIVKKYSKKKWFNNILKKKLDLFVSRLEKKGFLNTPYDDRKW